MFDHVDLCVRSLARSLPFYRELLAHLGREGETTIEGERGATIDGGPGERGYAAGYHAVFFFDPDGLKLEVVHQPE
jgi:catechol 2,3-dioxygenase-like lactoylglutathione lyase family enzyme